MRVGDEVVCHARWVYGWIGVVVQVGNNMVKLKWNDKTAGESWVETSYLTPVNRSVSYEVQKETSGN